MSRESARVSMIQTRAKLDEARDFLHRMIENERTTRLDLTHRFRRSLSAFLNSCYSIKETLPTEFIQTAPEGQKKQRKEWSRRWWENWQKELAEEDRKVWEFLNKQRNKEVHRLGAEVSAEVEYVLPGEIAIERQDPAYGIHLWGPPELFAQPPTKIGIRVHYFTIRGTREKAIDVCGRYLGLHEKLIEDFEQAFRGE